MRRHLLGTALAVSLLAGVLAPVAPASAAKAFDMVKAEYIVKTRHGKIYVQVMHPAKGDKIVKAPAVFTYSPYWAVGLSENFRRNNDAEDWVPQGYARVWADVVGTGNSGGCYDYGGKREKETGYDLVEWIADQKWSTGKVGMMGGSYEGTTATAAAVERPPHLTTIVPDGAISRWYGYAYSGGIRYLLNNEHPADEGVDTPAAFDFGLAVPPPLDPQNPDWAERFQENVRPCDEISHTEHGYDDTPDYDKFWLERDYLKDADKIRIPVLVAHNWGDWNVKQEEGWNLFNALDNSRKRVLYFGSRYAPHDTPGGSDNAEKWNKFVHAWMDHWLMGKDNGIDKAPTYISQPADSKKALKFTSFNKPQITNVELVAQQTAKVSVEDYEWKLLPQKPQITPISSVREFPSGNINTEAHMNHHARSNHDWSWFESPMLKQDVRIFGTPKVQVQLQSDREWITVTPTIVDIDPACHQYLPQVGHVTNPTCINPEGYNAGIHSVTRGWLDSRYRNGLAKQKPTRPGVPVTMTVVEKPTDYVFRKGHHIGLQITTEINEWSIPKSYPCSSLECALVRVVWEGGKTRVVLPVMGKVGDPRDLFDFHAGH